VLAGPLAGVTIIDAAIFYATGGGVAQLADLGARVIKIEPVGGDPYRRSARGMGGDNVVRAMQGKENLALNLKDKRGQEIAHRLVARADAFVHNFRLGVPERLGIDYPTLRAVNPRLVYHYAAAYGSIGPYARQPAIDHVIAAFTGMTAHQAGAGNRPLKEQGADPVAALGVGAALMLGLRARDRSGQSQYVESTMIQSNLYMNVEDALSYAGKPPRRPVDPLQLGDGATHRLYQTEPRRDRARIAAWEDPESRWIFLSAVEDREFTRFCAATGRHDLAADRRFATRGSREDHDAALAMALEALFLTRPADVWESTLLGAGVGCVVADAMSFHAFLHRHPQARALGMTTLTGHPSLGGGYWRPAPAVTLSDTAAEVGRFCDCGEHSRAILREVGFDDDHIDELRANGVVTWPTG
jgi:crotonobetainyl-CoA:carnitine CoA-transferase CaiB-like acyl-CoA transferase